MAVMTVKSLLPLALLVAVVPASAQLSRRTFGGLPSWADSALVAKRASRELGTGRNHGNEERKGEEGFHGHNRHTRVQRAAFTRLRLERPNLSGRTVAGA